MIRAAYVVGGHRKMRYKNVLWDGRAGGRMLTGGSMCSNGEIRNNFHCPQHK